jgi:omega-6 fatty acid desaturase (delta-12 desaturase)
LNAYSTNRAEMVMPPLRFEAIPPDSPLPHRKIIRSWMLSASKQDTLLALWLSVLDLSLFAISLAATVLVTAVWAKIVLGMVTGFIIGRLFILGHDACHQSFTRHRRLNAWLGRLLFLPSMTPYSLWAVGHNVVHHGYTNLKDADFVWRPHSLQEFQDLPRWRQRLERLYRSGWAPYLYYAVDMWWRRMYFPSKKQMPTRRAVFFWDGVLVTAGFTLWLAMLVWAAGATGQSLWLVLLTALLLPLLFWKAMIGFVVYVHHTHVGVAWYRDKTRWAASQPFVSTTVHLTFKYRIGALLHHIMEHTAHHVDMSVPLYRLKKAQRLLETMLPGRIVIQKFSWRWYFDTARRCKLYDYERLCWTDFNGHPTSVSLLPPAE